jgi:hypothetical protein
MATLLEEDFRAAPNSVAIVNDEHFVTGSSGAHGHTLLIWDFVQYGAEHIGA